MFYAMSDEIHKLYVPGRVGQVKDLFIDSDGSVVGNGVYGFLKRIIIQN